MKLLLSKNMNSVYKTINRMSAIEFNLIDPHFRKMMYAIGNKIRRERAKYLRLLDTSQQTDRAFPEPASAKFEDQRYEKYDYPKLLNITYRIN